MGIAQSQVVRLHGENSQCRHRWRGCTAPPSTDLIQGRKSAAFDFPSIDAALDLAVAGQRWLFSGWPHRRARRNTPMTSYEWCCKASGSSGRKSRSDEDSLPALHVPTKSRSLFSDGPRA